MNELLIGNNFIAVPNATLNKVEDNTKTLGTILSNMAYYGFIPSKNAYEALASLSQTSLVSFWTDVEPAFKEVTGDNRNMDEFVVYKNFPKEVLEMSEAQYWVYQILMYWGLPNQLFAEDKKDRPLLTENKNLKVLSLADENTASIIYTNLVKNTARWSDKQVVYAKALLVENNVTSLEMDAFSFKENGVLLINEVLKVKKEDAANKKNGKPLSIAPEVEISISNATDVLRLASAMSEGDISLREKTKFRKFTRGERRFLLEKLENSNNLFEDFGLKAEQFKKLLAGLHPGDYSFSKVKLAYDALYRNQIKTFNSQVETNLMTKDNTVLELLKTRPGEFFRRLHTMYGVFNKEAIKAFKDVAPQLKTIQLVKLDSYLATINDRKKLIIAPKGNWTKANVFDNNKVKIQDKDLKSLRKIIGEEIATRLNTQFPNGVDVDIETKNIKLQTNDQKLATYGRGTSFAIPQEMSYLRSASYWEQAGYGNNWFDNGWNFFDESWKSKGTCCWNSTHTMDNAAVFSGDPTNSKDLKGRACQMIDLYLDKLEEKGVRYAVWNILSFSNIKFNDATDVLATLQWGEKAEEGNLFEPSRAQMVFPITGDNLTKYIAYIDVVERKLVYMDANLFGNISSAQENASHLEAKMPAYLEYLNALPSVADLFSHAKAGDTPIYYSDKDKEISKELSAYVFKPENANNDFAKIDLATILDGGKVEISKKKTLKK